ncbi:MAG: ABC transporter permease, partial [Chloroflexi bacterium]|nr:ABC transporter permease [Chloroflexota bacterium]
MVGLVFVAAVALAALLAGVIAPYDPLAMNFDALLVPPSATHPMGTDMLGRDLLSRVLYGSRYALLIGMGVVVLQMVLGGALGLIAGFVGGVVDSLIMRMVD